MVENDWQKVREIFDSALHRKPEERQKYIAQACGGNELLFSEVESLLTSFNNADSFMETPAVAGIAEAIKFETRRLENGQSFAHYQIINLIGEGGMGEVYLAEDNKLDRKVAIKILNAEFSRHESNLKRFIQEAKSASALNHPNILVIHEIGAENDTNYIVSEFINGKTLREVLREKSLELTEVLDIAIQTAGAVIAAHETHLVHRDIKPENIMIRPDGLIKVLDFGLAKLVEQKNESFLSLKESTLGQHQTAKGVILGTVNYMSPEQAKGEKVDQRTDIFSLGVLIYEMIAGQTPFQGDSPSETFANLINREPSSLEQFEANVPDELRGIIKKMLHKNKAERYQTMEDVFTNLKELRGNLLLETKLERSVTSNESNGTQVLETTTAQTFEVFSQSIKRHKSLAVVVLIGLLAGLTALFFYSYKSTNTSVGEKKSIAVLPLKPINTANRDEIYEIGIADSLIHRLSSMKGFVVRPLSATRKYGDLAQDPIAAGKEQKVDYVLVSNYQVVGGKIRVTAQLFNVDTEQIEETYKSEKDAGDLFAMQDAIASEVENKLQTRFEIIATKPTVKRGTTNEEAYRLYLQGKNWTARVVGADAKKAIECFEQAIKLDPNYASAFAGMAQAYILSGNVGGGLPREQFEKARATVNKALELDPNLAEAYAVRSNLKFRYDWDFPGAEEDYRRANELDPNRLRGVNFWIIDLTYLGRFDEAESQINDALVVDPTSFELQNQRGRFLYFARRYDEAIVQFKRVAEVNENSGDYAMLMLACEMKGDNEQTFVWFMKSQKRGNPERLEIYQKAYETGGWKEVRRKLLEFEKAEELTPAGNAFRVARQATLLGEKETAFEYLNKALEKRHSQMVMLKVEPAFDSLRDDPRFDELLRRVGLK